MKSKILTIRIPEKLWKKLNYLRIEGKIKSIQEAAIKGLMHVTNQYKSDHD
jgi:hypothetical protein